MAEKELCTCGNHPRWRIHRGSRSIHTETCVIGSYRTPSPPSFVFERVPCDGEYGPGRFILRRDERETKVDDGEARQGG